MSQPDFDALLPTLKDFLAENLEIKFQAKGSGLGHTIEASLWLGGQQISKDYFSASDIEYLLDKEGY